MLVGGSTFDCLFLTHVDIRPTDYQSCSIKVVLSFFILNYVTCMPDDVLQVQSMEQIKPSFLDL